MTTRVKVELSIVTLCFFGMLSWGLGCAPGQCMERLSTWLPIWWALGGLSLLYVIWRKS